jgi:hypothetical protein
VTLPVQWDILAAHTEAYPERNAWYLDEIAQMTSGGHALITCGVDATALVMIEKHPAVQVIAGVGVSPDEAIERLYQQVYVWWCERETRADVRKRTRRDTDQPVGMKEISTPAGIFHLLST